MEGFATGLDPIAIMEKAWEKMPKFLMHCPKHHYLVAAYRKPQGNTAEQLGHDLAMALERARNVLGGFC